MDLLTFPGSDRVLARHREVLPQPDQLCGPFSTHVALHAVLDSPPAVVELAIGSSTRIWPSDVAEWRPPGAVLRTEGWGSLAHATTPEDSGTDAVGVVAAVAALTDVDVVPVAGAGLGLDALRHLLRGLLHGPAVGVVANLRTGPLSPDAAFDVGHFVVLWGCSSDASVVGVADTYAELGDADQPPGRRVVPLEALHAALVDPPGRGLLLLASRAEAAALHYLVIDSGAPTALWST